MSMPMVVAAHDELERVELVREPLEPQRLESVRQVRRDELSLQPSERRRQTRHVEEARVKNPLEHRAITNSYEVPVTNVQELTLDAIDDRFTTLEKLIGKCEVIEEDDGQGSEAAGHNSKHADDVS